MSNICNSLNIKTLKISQLKEYDTVKPDDLFLVIESGLDLHSRKSKFSSIVDSLQYIEASYIGQFSGNFTGNSIGQLTGSFSGSGKGNFDGIFTGSILSNNLKATGSFKFNGNPSLTGSFYGTNNIFNFKNTGINVSFNGTASYSVSSSFSTYALAATTLTTDTGIGVGVTNQYAYWNNDDTLGSSDYLLRIGFVNKKFNDGDSDLTGVNYFNDGRNAFTRPSHFYSTGQYLLGESLIFQSASNQSIFGMGMQENTLYLRTDSNFVMYHSGVFDLNEQIGGGDVKDRYLNPGTNGFTSFVSTKRLIGIGDFRRTDEVNAQCHVHIDKSYGYRNSYVPKANAFLVTSGSNFNKLLRVDGDGNLDVDGDIIALSTFATSDSRLKHDIKSIENHYELLNKLNPIEFKWNHSDKPDYGLIAQEVENNFPNLIKEDFNGYKTVKYNSFIPILIESIKDLKKEIDNLKEKINKIENNS